VIHRAAIGRRLLAFLFARISAAFMLEMHQVIMAQVVEATKRSKMPAHFGEVYWRAWNLCSDAIAGTSESAETTEAEAREAQLMKRTFEQRCVQADGQAQVVAQPRESLAERVAAGRAAEAVAGAVLEAELVLARHERVGEQAGDWHAVRVRGGGVTGVGGEHVKGFCRISQAVAVGPTERHEDACHGLGTIGSAGHLDQAVFTE
jgi:hypothetical protein